jgi:hypothetical protein
MEDVAGAVLAQFAERLEAELRGDPAPAGSDAELDVSAAVRGPLLERAGLVLAGLLAGVALGRVVWRR